MTSSSSAGFAYILQVIECCGSGLNMHISFFTPSSIPFHSPALLPPPPPSLSFHPSPSNPLPPPTMYKAPAIVEPGDNTTTEVEEDEFRFFQSECAAFSLTIMIEQIDLVGRSSLYASSTVQNPGPLSSPGSIVRNEDRSVRRRSVLLTLSRIARRVSVYVCVGGGGGGVCIASCFYGQKDAYRVPELVL